MLWLVAGLGNPGLRYSSSRHNLGFWAIDHISAKWGIPLSKKSHHAFWGEGRVGQVSTILSKPQTFMNRSGFSIESLMNSRGGDPSHLIVIYDDMDLPIAEVRVRDRGGSGGHKGLRSVIDHLGSDAFLRIRIGIGRPDSCIDPTDFVLERCPPPERETLLQVIHKTDEMVEAIIQEGPQVAMNLFNH